MAAFAKTSRRKVPESQIEPTAASATCEHLIGSGKSSSGEASASELLNPAEGPSPASAWFLAISVSFASRVIEVL